VAAVPKVPPHELKKNYIGSYSREIITHFHKPICVFSDGSVSTVQVRWNGMKYECMIRVGKVVLFLAYVIIKF
jgi:hypothetical protein